MRLRLPPRVAIWAVRFGMDMSQVFYGGTRTTCIHTATHQMTTPQGRRPTTSGASAGIFILSAVLICTALGLGAGTLLGSAVAGGVTGVMVGFATGIALVIVRFKDL